MFSAERLVEIVQERSAERPEHVQLYWTLVEGDRDQYCAEVARLASPFPLVPIVLRSAYFDDPNSVAEDVVQLLERSREAFASEVLERSELPIRVLLISRAPLAVPQSSSPATFPRWFPRYGGEVVPVLVECLESAAEGRLDAPEVRLDEVRALVYQIDAAMVDRLREALGRDRRLCDAFGAHFLEPGEKVGDLVENCGALLAATSDPRAYRPGMREGNSVVARIWRVAAACSPDGAPAKAKALMKALRVPEDHAVRAPESIFALLNRTATPLKPRDTSIRFGSNLISTLYAAYQLVNGAAHAGEYPRYPYALLQATSHNLRLTLARLHGALVQPPE